MALTKIFTGMEKGPEAIDDNFNRLNFYHLNPSITTKDSGWWEVTLKNSTGNMYIRRTGSNVMASGLFKPTAFATLSNPLELFSIPSGFTPDISKFKFYNAVSGAIESQLRLSIGSDGMEVRMIFSPTDADKAEWQANFSWTTNDDFPN